MTDDVAGLVERLLGRGPNQGHGHVFPRPDGVRARCGGTGLCRQCQQDRALVDKLPDALQSHAAEIARLRGEVEEARAALQDLLQYEGHHAYCGHGRDIEKPCVCGLMKAHQQARAALAQQGGER